VHELVTGRFTQEDPIGLAGGLNLYGFANGDPVNFSDPFGLHPILWRIGAWLAARSPVLARLLGLGAATTKLAPAIARTFQNSTYTATKLASDMRVYRVFGGGAEQPGRFFTTNLPASSNAARAALNLPVQNAATQVVEAVIPRGTTVFQGLVQGGNAIQVFVTNPAVVRFGAVTQLPQVAP